MPFVLATKTSSFPVAQFVHRPASHQPASFSVCDVGCKRALKIYNSYLRILSYFSAIHFAAHSLLSFSLAIWFSSKLKCNFFFTFVHLQCGLLRCVRMDSRRRFKYVCNELIEWTMMGKKMLTIYSHSIRSEFNLWDRDRDRMNIRKETGVSQMVDWLSLRMIHVYTFSSHRCVIELAVMHDRQMI